MSLRPFTQGDQELYDHEDQLQAHKPKIIPPLAGPIPARSS